MQRNFGEDNTEAETAKGHRPAGEREAEAQETETVRWEEGKKVEKIHSRDENTTKRPAGRGNGI
eukprot:4059087-Pleurochrysis_carterae.AAC.2